MTSLTNSTHGRPDYDTLPTEAFWPANQPRSFLVPFIFSSAISYIVFGAMLANVQSSLRKGGPTRLRIVMWILLLLNVLHGVLQVSRDVRVLGWHYGDWRALLAYRVKPQDILLPLLSVFIVFYAQTVMATRSYLFSRSLSGGRRPALHACVWAVISLFIVLSFGAGMISLSLEAAGAPNYAFKEKFQILNRVHPILQTLWILFGTVADLGITFAMWKNARRVTSSQSLYSVVRVISDVAVRCGAVLLISQTLLQILFFAHSHVWAEGAHNILPRAATLALAYSISSPREAYRQQQLGHEVLPGGGVPPGRPATPAPGPPSYFSSKGWKARKAGRMFRWRGRSESSHESKIGEVDDSGGTTNEKALSVTRAEEVGVLPQTAGNKAKRRGGAGGRSAALIPQTRSVHVQTTSCISIERATEDDVHRFGVELGNSVRISGPPKPPARSFSTNTSRPPAPISSSSSRHPPPPAPPSRPPDFISSFPAGPTVTSSIHVYDPVLDDEYDLRMLGGEG